MIIKLPKDPMLLPDFHTEATEVEEIRRELEEWLAQLMRSLEEYFRKTHQDISTLDERVTALEP